MQVIFYPRLPTNLKQILNSRNGWAASIGKRFAVLAAFLTILIVWAFVLADKSPYLMYLSNYELNLHLTIWSSLLILMGWTGSFLAKTFQKKPEEEPQS